MRSRGDSRACLPTSRCARSWETSAGGGPETTPGRAPRPGLSASYAASPGLPGSRLPDQLLETRVRAQIAQVLVVGREVLDVRAHRYRLLEQIDRVVLASFLGADDGQVVQDGAKDERRRVGRSHVRDRIFEQLPGRLGHIVLDEVF